MGIDIHVPKRELAQNAADACSGARASASKLRAEGMFIFGSNFSDWRMTIMNQDAKTDGEYPLEEHEGTYAC